MVYGANQLFTAGILRLRNSATNAIDFFDDVGDEYGVEDTPSPDVEDSEGVAVPAVSVTHTSPHIAAVRRIAAYC